MEELKFNYKIIDFGPTYLLGKKTIVEPGKTAVKFVKEFRTDGSNDFLQKLEERVSPKGDLIIWMGDYNSNTKTFVEVAGVFVKEKCQIKEEYILKELLPCKMAILMISGKTRNLSKGAHNKLVELMKEQGYIPDYSYGYSMEYYSYDSYEKENEIYEFSYYLPCKKVI